MNNTRGILHVNRKLFFDAYLNTDQMWSEEGKRKRR